MSPNHIFENELPIVCKTYPSLCVKGTDGHKYLKGILDINDGDGNYYGSFSIEIRCSERYPYRFPILYEVGGDIPCDVDWHKYQDCSLCLDVEQSEILRCRNGISLLDFIDGIAIPHLANQLHKKIHGEYVDEYKHGVNGVREFYTKLLGTTDTSIWVKSAHSIFVGPPKGRNEACYYGSGIKYKHCHLDADKKLSLIGFQKVYEDFKSMGVL